MPRDPWDDPDPWETDETGPVPQAASQPPESISREPIEVVGNPQIPADEAFKIGAGQGAFGLGDEISSGLKAVRDTAISPERKWQDTLRLYQAYKANSARDRAAAQQQHPLAYMGGVLPVAAAMGNVSSALVPAAAMAAAPIGANIVTNMGQSIAQNWGQDTLTPGNVVKDVAFGEAMALPLRVAQHGIRRTAGDALQLPQRGLDEAADRIGGTKIGQTLGANADELSGNMSKRVKDLKLAEESYLTDAGKQGLAASEAVSGDGVASRLAKSASEGNASLGPGGYSFNPAEFGDEFARRVSGSRSEAIRSQGNGMVIPSDEHAVTDLMSGFDAPRVRARASFQDIPPAIPGSPERQAMDSTANAIKGRFAENMDVSVNGVVDDARSVLEQWQAAKAAQQASMSRAADAGAELGRIQTGRGALQNAAGMLGAGSAGHSVGGPVGALLGVAAGKQLGKGAFQAIDLAGEAGQQLAAAVPTVERLAAGGGPLGRAAQWVLSGEGPAFVARLATLVDMPEFQSEMTR